MTVLLKTVVLVSAAVCLILRLVTFKYSGTLAPGTVDALNITAYAAAGVLLVSGVLWSVLEKKKAKKMPAGTDEDGENPENGGKNEENE